MDETEKLILGDTAIVAGTGKPPRRFFSRSRKVQPPLLPYCENCEATMTGPYCAKCGQHAVDYRRSFGRVFADVLDSFLNWDSKFFATLGLLITKPWCLTNSFLQGRRVRYVHPLRLYLLISVAFFFGVHELAKRGKFEPHRSAEITSEQRAKIDERLAKLPGGVRDEIRADLDKESKRKTMVHVGTNDDPNSGSAFEKWLKSRVKTRIGDDGAYMKAFMLTVVSNLPAMMLFCVPLFAFVLKLLYIRKRVFYVDHLIYALHIHAFAYLAILVIGFTIAGLKFIHASSGWLNAALIFTAVSLLLVSIRRVYRQSWFMSVVKFLFGGFVYVVVLSMALAATFLATLALPD